MWHAWERKGNCTGCLWESPRERDHSEERGVDGMGSEWISGRVARGWLSGYNWFNIMTGGGFL
jgi:hypothetical protein